MKLTVQGAIHHARGVGEHDALYPHHPHDALDFLHIRGLDEAGDDIDLIDPLPRMLGEVLDHALGHGGEPRDVRALEARRIGMDYPLAFGDLPLGLCLVDDLWQVVTDHLGEARRMDRDHVRPVDGKDVVDRLDQVGLSPEYRGAFRE